MMNSKRTTPKNEAWKVSGISRKYPTYRNSPIISIQSLLDNMWSSKAFAVLSGVLLVAISLSHIPTANGANILGVFTSSSPSHLIVHMSTAKALAERGHNVTVVTVLEPKVNHPSIRNILIPQTKAQEDALKATVADMSKKKFTPLTMVKNIFGSLGQMIGSQVEVMKDKRFTALYETPDTKFDLVLIGYFMNDFQVGIAAKFNCPLILEWTGQTNEMTDWYIGNPRENSYVPGMGVSLKDGETMSFVQRLQTLGTSLVFRFISFVLDWRAQSYYNELFPTENFPTYAQMKKNVSMLFANGHFSEGPIRPNVPALVEIGGIQIKDKPDPLPKDIAEFLDSSKKHGAVLFSLGSNFESSNIQPEIVTMIFKTLANLKQNVIWKWDKLDQTPGKSPNIIYKKWLPQDDILAHPNLKLFITHAGKGGLAEAQYHGVPMVALPVFADQSNNAQKMASSGFGRELDLLGLTETPFKQAVVDVLSNPVYARNIKKFSQLYRDRPLTAKQNAVFWVEYVIRHHGAPHLQSPLVHMNAIQSLNVDVFAFIGLVFYAMWRLAKLAFKFVCKLCRRNSKKTGSKKVKKQ